MIIYKVVSFFQAKIYADVCDNEVRSKRLRESVSENLI